jgi:hypothetical protein
MNGRQPMVSVIALASTRTTTMIAMPTIVEKRFIQSISNCVLIYCTFSHPLETGAAGGASRRDSERSIQSARFEENRSVYRILRRTRRVIGSPNF